MADTKIPVYDKWGRLTGYRDSGAKGATETFNPRPGGLAAAAAAAKAKASPSPEAMNAASHPDSEVGEKKDDEGAEDAAAKRKSPVKPKASPSPTATPSY